MLCTFVYVWPARIRLSTSSHSPAATPLFAAACMSSVVSVPVTFRREGPAGSSMVQSGVVALGDGLKLVSHSHRTMPPAVCEWPI